MDALSACRHDELDHCRFMEFLLCSLQPDATRKQQRRFQFGKHRASSGLKARRCAKRKAEARLEKESERSAFLGRAV